MKKSLLANSHFFFRGEILVLSRTQNWTWRSGKARGNFFFLCDILHFFYSLFSSAAAVAILFHQMTTTRWKCAKESASSCWANSLPSSMQNEFCLFFSGLGQGFRKEAVEEGAVEGLKSDFWIFEIFCDFKVLSVHENENLLSKLKGFSAFL